MDKVTQEKLEGLYKKFAEHLPERIKTIESNWHSLKTKQWDAESWLNFQQLVHALGGSTGIYGFKELSTQLYQLEALAKQAIAAAPAPNDILQMDKIVSSLHNLLAPGA